MIQLSKEQEQALNKIKEFINSKDVALSLTGSAGTGKSLLISYVIEYLESINKRYCLCAPTHKAKTVIEYYTHRDALTLHKLLSLSPKLDLLELDFNDLQFQSGSSSEFPKNGVIICDEGSMINDSLFDFLQDKCIEKQTKVIFVSDSKQLAPVKSETLSKVYSIKNQICLTHIFRQSEKNAILDTLQTLREHSIPEFKTSTGEEGSLFCEPDFKEFFNKCSEGLKKAIDSQDIFEAKVTAFRNSRVNKYNEFLKKNLFGNSEEYYKFEILTGYENIEFNYYKFYNSMDYIIEDVQAVDIFIPNFQKLPGFSLTLYDSGEKETKNVEIISNKLPNDTYDNLAYIIESLRMDAIMAKNGYRKSQCWKKYFSTMNSFTTPRNLYFDNRLIRGKSFDRGYACTVHKLQGSTLNNIYIDMKDINSCHDEQTKRQLQYVALSRARNNVYIYQ